MEKTNYDTKLRNKKLINYMTRTKEAYILGFVFIILAVLADLAGPYIIKRILDKELIDGIGPRDINFYILIIFIYVLAIICSTIFRYFNMYYFNKTANKVVKFMQEDVFVHLQKLPISFFDKQPAGSIVSRITNDSMSVKTLFKVVLSDLMTSFVYAIGVYITLAFIDIKLALMGLIPLPIIIWVFIDFKNKSKKFNYAYRRYLADLNANLNENIQGMEIIKAYNKEDDIYKEIDDLNLKVYGEGIKFTKLFAYSGYNIMDTIFFFTLVCALLYFGYGYLTKRYDVTIGSLFIFVEYMRKITEHLSQAVVRGGELEKAIGSADHIFELLGVEPDKNNGEIKADIKGNVEFNNISFAYDEEYVIKDMSFKVKKAESIAFVGHTGSGKSTIMNLILGFYRPQKGKILIDGYNIKDLDMKSMREKIAIVLQDPYLFTGDIYSNISLFDDKISPKDAEKALIEVGGKELLNKLELGINSPIIEKGSTLSSGERQIISFARALIRDPKILVLDEATSNIDSETEAFIQEGIEKLKKGRTTFIIAHRLSTIKNVDKIFVLDNGRIVESGNHDELIEFDGIYKKMYLAQSN